MRTNLETGTSRSQALDSVDNPRNRVTVGIPYFNCRSHIRGAVESILGQTHRDLTLVVVNDGDEAPPWDLLGDIDDPRLIRFDLEANRGRDFVDEVVVGAMTDPYYAVQGANDWSEADRISTLLQALREGHASGAVSPVSVERGSLEPIAPLVPKVSEPLTATGHHGVPHVGLYRADALRAVGGCYGGLRAGYDSLLISLLMMTGRLACVDAPLYNRRMANGSLRTSIQFDTHGYAQAEAHERVEAMYAEAFGPYRRYLAGSLERSALVAAIRAICLCGVTDEDRQALTVESGRLRKLLVARRPIQTCRPPRPRRADPQTTPPSAHRVGAACPTEPPLGALFKSPHLVWDHGSISKSLATALTKRLTELRPRRVLELGSGTSTALLAAYAAKSGASIVTAEHLVRFHQRTEVMLQKLHLAEYVDLRLTPLTSEAPAKGAEHARYAIDLDGTFDFVFIDGPPRQPGRLGTLPAIWPHLGSTWEVWMKDGCRMHEQTCVERWRQQFPFVSTLTSDHDHRGVWILKPSSANDSQAPHASTESSQISGPLSTISEPRPGPRVEAVAEPTESADDPSENPLVSCLCVTERRAPFMPWLIWCFDRQSWPNRELVIVDGSSTPLNLPQRPDIRVVPSEHGTSVGEKRNQALAAADGEILTWFDDDDWQHPLKLTWLVSAMADGAPYAGATRAWFVDLARERCARHDARRWILFNSAGFRRDAVSDIRFDAQRKRGSDTLWMRAIRARYAGLEALINEETVFFWLCHQHNLSNTATRRRLDSPLSDLIRRVESPHWEGTSAALKALRARIRSPSDRADGAAPHA